MKLLLTFFIFICFDWLGGQAPVVAGIHNFNAYPSSSPDLAKTNAVAADRHFLTDHSATSGEKELAILIEEDDEENNDRKFKTFIVSLSTCCYAFIHFYTHRDFTNRLPVRRYLSHISSCKYIAQRVLRI